MSLILPGLIVLLLIYAYIKKADVYSAFISGALEALPASLEEAIARAGGSAFVEKVLSADTARKYLALKQAEQNRWFAARDKEKYQDEAYFGVL